ncbi:MULTISPECIES: phytanoyl-CoA dioxygenase family protein [unclassified Pseudomonas]|uniref:phytanoyl-CoA dioxygenase family protein n=1 Tax=unclassified Pseudomonas TaxID=196821 RepID=UPI000C9B9245|nr:MULTISPECIES: phytanoyl-CoA dioxygenase family protein [unclassified Pseudomonas]PNB46762.1 phytanoyl-CoA dioxygenase [Pseudomonas sp. GW456-12-10-14-LB2]TEA58471.1 phytanoyl-CoA dioxygenase [Pseudomonas sp. CH235]
MTSRELLHSKGYEMLFGAVPHTWLTALRIAFDTGIKSSNEWPVPRGIDWRHSQLDVDPTVQAVCRLPQLLAVVGELIGERFFLSLVEGRGPLINGGHQQLHRDLSAQRPGDTINALVYLDDYGLENGATRIVTGSHRPALDEPPFDFTDESRFVQLTGNADDILIFDADLIHAGSLNASGAHRRSLLITWFSEALYSTHLETVSLRNIRMDTTERSFRLTLGPGS